MPNEKSKNRLPAEEPSAANTPNVAESVKQVGQAAMERFNEFSDQATQTYEHGREQFDQWVDDVSQRATEEPVKTLLIAAGIGVVLGVLFG